MRRAGLPQSLARVIMRNFVFPPERPPSQGSEGAVIRAATQPPEGRRARSQRLPLSHHTKPTHFLLFLVSKSGRLLLGRTTVCAGTNVPCCCFGTRAPCGGTCYAANQVHTEIKRIYLPFDLFDGISSYKSSCAHTYT